jgi:hypothetical protein
MRKILLALAVCLLPIVGLATSGPASAAAPGNMTLIDKIQMSQSMVDHVQRRCYTRCRNVCTKRIFGKCVRTVRRCTRHCYRRY